MWLKFTIHVHVKGYKIIDSDIWKNEIMTLVNATFTFVEPEQFGQTHSLNLFLSLL